MPAFAGRRRRTGSSIAEFGAAFYAFCLAILIPTVNFLAFAASFSYSYLNANMMADTVAQAITLKRARAIVEDSALALQSDALAKFLKVEPSEDAFKVDLVRTTMQGESVVVTNLNKTISENERSRTYLQYRITANYTARPMLNLGSIPLVNQIPIVGKESTISFKLHRLLEHLDDSFADAGS